MKIDKMSHNVLEDLVAVKSDQDLDDLCTRLMGLEEQELKKVLMLFASIILVSTEKELEDSDLENEVNKYMYT